MHVSSAYHVQKKRGREQRHQSVITDAASGPASPLCRDASVSAGPATFSSGYLGLCGAERHQRGKLVRRWRTAESSSDNPTMSPHAEITAPSASHKVWRPRLDGNARVFGSAH